MIELNKLDNNLEKKFADSLKIVRKFYFKEKGGDNESRSESQTDS